jgi:hypothetical protein
MTAEGIRSINKFCSLDNGKYGHTSKCIHERSKAPVEHFEKRISNWVLLTSTQCRMFLEKMIQPIRLVAVHANICYIDECTKM